MRPLDFLRSIKMKLGVVIVAAVGVTSLVIAIGHLNDLPMPLLFVGASILALGMVQLLARGMTSPLREMARAARAMAAGDYGQRVRATSRDEVGELARAFNRMAQDLEAVDRTRRDLLANASHELRTPLSALQAVLENLVDGVEEPEAATFETMLSQVERLSRLVSQLLDLSRLESGAVPLERAEVDLHDVAHAAAREAGLQRPGIEVAEQVPPGLVVPGDAERLHQVLANLLANAVRHSPAGGTVSVLADRLDGRVRIAVCDEGPGLPPGEAERVFERFYRADPGRAPDVGGSGLGLSIARWVVDLHGGSIRAEDREPHGCRMVVELPADPEPAPDTEVGTATRDGDRDD